MVLSISRIVKIFVNFLLIKMIISMSIDYRVMQICQLSIVMAESNFKISNDKTENKKLPKKKKKNIKLLKKKNNEGVAKKNKKI